LLTPRPENDLPMETEFNSTEFPGEAELLSVNSLNKPIVFSDQHKILCNNNRGKRS